MHLIVYLKNNDDLNVENKIKCGASIQAHIKCVSAK